MRINYCAAAAVAGAPQRPHSPQSPLQRQHFFFKNQYGHTNMAVRKQTILNFPSVNDDIFYVDGGPRRAPHWAVIRLLEYGSCT